LCDASLIMKKKTKKYNWHFWIPEYKAQIVIENGSYQGAVSHYKEKFHYYNKPAPEFKFQFGQII
jgi:hypothetical protein